MPTDPIAVVILTKVAADLTGKMILAAGFHVKKRFSTDPQRLALENALRKALTATVASLTDDAVLSIHYAEMFDNWAKSEEVVGEISAIIDPSAGDEPDRAALRRAFEEAGYDANYLEEVDLDRVAQRFFVELEKAIDAQESLQGRIQTRLLREIARSFMKAEWRAHSLRDRYLERVIIETRCVPWIGRDRRTADPQLASLPRRNLPDVYIALDATLYEDVRVTPVLALEALARHGMRVLLGRPGSGKSTFVNHLAFCLATYQREGTTDALAHLEVWPQEWRDLLPIRVVVRDFAAWIQEKDPQHGNIGLLTDYLGDWLKGRNLQPFHTALCDDLRDGRAILLLDGLDEIPNDSEVRRLLREMATDLPTAVENSPILITCRSASYPDGDWGLPEETWPTFELAPFDEDKIDRFIDAWYSQLADAQGELDEDARSDKLRNAVRDPNLQEMAASPLLLTMIAIALTHSLTLPDARVKLYQECVELLLWKWEQIKLADQAESGSRLLLLLKEAGAEKNEIDLCMSLRKLAFDQWERMSEEAGRTDLPNISLYMLIEELRTLHPTGSRDWAAEIVTVMKQRSGLLVEEAEGIYRFPHRTFQEYLTGWHLTAHANFARNARTYAERGVHWDQVILLAVGRLVHVDGNIESPALLVESLCRDRLPEADDKEGWRQFRLGAYCFLEIGPDRIRKVVGIGENLVEKMRRHGGWLRDHEAPSLWSTSDTQLLLTALTTPTLPMISGNDPEQPPV